jgi:hypothetical protein
LKRLNKRLLNKAEKPPICFQKGGHPILNE